MSDRYEIDDEQLIDCIDQALDRRRERTLAAWRDGWRDAWSVSNLFYGIFGIGVAVFMDWLGVI